MKLHEVLDNGRFELRLFNRLGIWVISAYFPGSNSEVLVHEETNYVRAVGVFRFVKRHPGLVKLPLKEGERLVFI